MSGSQKSLPYPPHRNAGLFSDHYLNEILPAEAAVKMTEIVRLETELNARVYALINLTPDEISLIEESTKYRYGEVR